jgi:hypothetical protein
LSQRRPTKFPGQFSNQPFHLEAEQRRMHRRARQAAGAGDFGDAGFLCLFHRRKYGLLAFIQKQGSPERSFPALNWSRDEAGPSG